MFRVLLPLLFIAFVGCAEDGIDQDHGPIKGVAQLGNCGLAADWVESPVFAKGRIVRDATSLSALRDTVFANAECRDSVQIDFAKYDLLLYPIRVKGCNMSVDRYFEIDKGKRVAHYKVVPTSYGSCSNMLLNLNAVLVEKLPADVSVTFEASK